jgi:hypothetical protein
VNINRAWEGYERISKLQPENATYYELKQYKPWCGDKRSKLFDQMKQAKLYGCRIHTK